MWGSGSLGCFFPTAICGWVERKWTCVAVNRVFGEYAAVFSYRNSDLAEFEVHRFREFGGCDQPKLCRLSRFRRASSGEYACCVFLVYFIAIWILVAQNQRFVVATVVYHLWLRFPVFGEAVWVWTRPFPLQDNFWSASLLFWEVLGNSFLERAQFQWCSWVVQ